MSRNIGFTKKEAEAIAERLWSTSVEAYAQKEVEVWHTTPKKPTHEYTVVLRKRRTK